MSEPFSTIKTEHLTKLFPGKELKSIESGHPSHVTIHFSDDSFIRWDAEDEFGASAELTLEFLALD